LEEEDQVFYVIYKRFASLWVIIGCDEDDNELSLFELIDAYMTLLNQIIPNVTELDLMFNLEKAYIALDEIIVHGQVVWFSSSKIRDIVIESTSLNK